jgi:hypothetical protein
MSERIQSFRDLRDTGIQIRIVPHDYGRCVDWREKEVGLIDFQNSIGRRA